MLLGPNQGGSITSLGLLRLLLEHTWYSTDQIGYVNRKVVGIKTLAQLMWASERTVQAALRDLEAGEFIRRYRHDEGQRRLPDDVWMNVLTMWYPDLSPGANLASSEARM